MKRAIVLSGGGAKGAYEFGFWKAIRNLDIDYDIVTGTSIGALNGIMMVQDDYVKCYKLWHYMNYDYVANMEIKGKYSTVNGKKEIVSKYTKGVLSGGYEMSGLSKVIDKAVDAEKFFESKVNYGLVTTYFPSFKGRYVKKNELNKDNLKDYLIATASCFPAFEPKKIGTNKFVDGGYTDNMPINLAIDLGADEIIAVDLGAIGIKKKLKNSNIPITLISPKNKLGNLLIFEKNYTRSYMKLGYNDTMKHYGALEGDNYTFKKGSLKRNYDRISPHFYNNLKNYLKRNININKYDEKKLNGILEDLASAFNIDFTDVYRTSLLNTMIKKQALKEKNKSYNTIRYAIRNNKLKKAFISKELICYIYKELENERRNVSRYSIMFPKAFLCAIYLKSIIR